MIAARLVLAVVLAVAAVAKLVDPKGSRAALEGFGVRGRLAAPLVVGLPALELGLAAFLIPGSTAFWAAAGALALLAAFTVAIGLRLRRGDRASCHCFGSLSSGPVGPGTVVRNLGLVALAGLAAATSTGGAVPSALGWIGDLTLAEGLALGNGVLLAALGAAGYGLLRQHGRLLLRLERAEQALAAHGLALPEPVAGLGVGDEAPDFELPALDGEPVALDGLLADERPALLVFSSPGCAPCQALMPEVGRWQSEHAGELTVAVLTRGGAEANRPKAEEHGLERVLLEDDLEVAEMYGAEATPTAVLVGPDGLVAAAPAAGPDAIRALVESVAGGGLALVHVDGDGSRGVLTVGDDAPATVLPALGGGERPLAEPGRETVLLFWNPGCGFCASMVDDLRAWEGESGRRELVLVAAGDPAATGALGLGSTVLLDPGFETAAEFGAGGTPMAVLVDADGRVGSPVVAGGEAVMGLLRDGRTAAAEAAV